MFRLTKANKETIDVLTSDFASELSVAQGYSDSYVAGLEYETFNSANLTAHDMSQEEFVAQRKELEWKSPTDDAFGYRALGSYIAFSYGKQAGLKQPLKSFDMQGAPR